MEQLKQALISDIKIGTRFRKDIGDLSSLEKSIAELNCLLHPIVVEDLGNEKFKLIAGRRRIAACKNLGWSKVPINTIKIPLLQMGELHENGARKNFTGSEIVAISEYIAKHRIGHRPKKGETGSPLPKGKTGDLVQEITGVSRNTVTRMKEIVDAAKENPEKFGKYVQELDEGTTPTKKLFREVKKLRQSDEKKEALKKIQTHLPKSVKLLNGDFKDNKIQKNSVSLIMTDPDYTNYNVQVYSDLARQAMQVLKDGGSMLCYVGQYLIPEVLDAVKKEGMNYHWIIPVIHSGPSSLMFDKKILVRYKPLLWFTKGKYDGDHVKDVIKSEFQGKDLHEWAQSTVESDYYIQHMTEEGEIVYDPCMGQGTFGISAAKLGRQFIGSDINPEHYKTASKLITLCFKKSVKKKDEKCSCTCHKDENRGINNICCSCTCDYDKLKKSTKLKSKKTEGKPCELHFYYSKNFSEVRGKGLGTYYHGGSRYPGIELQTIADEVEHVLKNNHNITLKVKVTKSKFYGEKQVWIPWEKFFAHYPQKKIKDPKKIKKILSKVQNIPEEVLSKIA